MRRLLTLAAVAGFATVTALTMAGPAGAAEASPAACSGSATSFDGGKQLSEASAPGSGGTSSDPFEIKSDGRVTYTHDLPSDIAGGQWKVQLYGFISFGGDIEPDAQASGEGEEPLEEHLQIGGFSLLVGKIKADVIVENPGGSEVCKFSGYIKIGDSIFKSPLTYAGIVPLGAGALLGLGAMGKAA